MLDSDPIALRAAHIKSSGLLGRSGQLSRIFDYLVECSVLGKSPKEIDIAVEALGRGAEFDVTQDAVVRVYVHKLRRRLEEFYTGVGRAEAQRLVIARGEYRLTLEPNETSSAAPLPSSGLPAGQEPQSSPNQPSPNQQPPDAPEAQGLQQSPSQLETSTAGGHQPRELKSKWLIGALVLSVLINLLLVGFGHFRPAPAEANLRRVRDNPIWAPLLRDDLPIVVVVGDYYIFGETDSTMNVRRMIREFDINSRRDLELYTQNHPEAAEAYMDLGLSYLPTSVAPALRELMPILTSAGKRVRVVRASDLTPDLLTRADIVYVGYLSAPLSQSRRPASDARAVPSPDPRWRNWR